MANRINKFTSIKQYRKEYVKAYYGRHGKSSGLNPGVLWPRKEELEHLKQYEAAFCPKLEDLILENKANREAKILARKEREAQVLRNLEKLPGEFKNFFEKIEAKNREKEQFLKEREARIEEVREILGFRAKPTDERFQKALVEKEVEEAKAAKKEARKKRENAGLDELLTAAQTSKS